MEIPLSPEVEASLKQLATQSGQTPAQVLQGLIDDKLAYRKSFLERIDAGLASLNRGEFLTHEEMEAKLAPYLQD